MILWLPIGLTKENFGVSKRRLRVTAHSALAVTLGNRHFDSSFKLYTGLLRIPKSPPNMGIEQGDYWAEMHNSNFKSSNATCQPQPRSDFL